MRVGDVDVARPRPARSSCSREFRGRGAHTPTSICVSEVSGSLSSTSVFRYSIASQMPIVRRFSPRYSRFLARTNSSVCLLWFSSVGSGVAQNARTHVLAQAVRGHAMAARSEIEAASIES